MCNDRMSQEVKRICGVCRDDPRLAALSVLKRMGYIVDPNISDAEILEALDTIPDDSLDA